MEKAGYILLGIAAVALIVGMVAGLIAAWPFGVVGLVALAGIALLLAKVVRDRVSSTEDDHYARNVDQ